MHASFSTHFPDHSALVKPLNTALQQISFSPLSLALHSLYGKVLEFEKICKWDVVCEQIGGFKQQELLRFADDLRVDVVRQRIVLEKGALANKFNPIYLCHKDFDGDELALDDQKFVSKLAQSSANLAEGFKFMEGGLQEISLVHDKILSLLSVAENNENALPGSEKAKPPFVVKLSPIYGEVTLALEAFKTEFSKQVQAAAEISKIATGLKQSPSDQPLGQAAQSYSRGLSDLNIEFFWPYPTGSM